MNKSCISARVLNIGAWMMQVGRNLVDDVDGFLRDKRYLILDRQAYDAAIFALFTRCRIERLFRDVRLELNGVQWDFCVHGAKPNVYLRRERHAGARLMRDPAAGHMQLLG